MQTVAVSVSEETGSGFGMSTLVSLFAGRHRHTPLSQSRTVGKGFTTLEGALAELSARRDSGDEH